MGGTLLLKSDEVHYIRDNAPRTEKVIQERKQRSENFYGIIRESSRELKRCTRSGRILSRTLLEWKNGGRMGSTRRVITRSVVKNHCGF